MFERSTADRFNGRQLRSGIKTSLLVAERALSQRPLLQFISALRSICIGGVAGRPSIDRQTRGVTMTA